VRLYAFFRACFKELLQTGMCKGFDHQYVECIATLHILPIEFS
jgi:hypothetical protein